MFVNPIHARRAIVLIVFAVLCALIPFARPTPAAKTDPLANEPAALSAATRRRAGAPPQRKPVNSRRRATNELKRPASFFSHATTGHSATCASCHITHTRRRLTQDNPDMTDYPYHTACVECHRGQFARGQFRRAAPSGICAVCHTTPGARDGTRHLFPKPKQPSQFADVFPHSSHAKTTTLFLFKKLDERGNLSSTCNYCHNLGTAVQKPQPGAQPDAFIAPAGTYMTTPTSHLSCFGCHWQESMENRDQTPLALECAGCHRSVEGSAETEAPATATGFVNPVASIHDTPAAALVFLPGSYESNPLDARRGALKFQHVMNPSDPYLDPHQTRLNSEMKQVYITCLSCHTATRKASTLEFLRAPENKPPLLACASSACHTAVVDSSARKISIYQELREREKDAMFDCSLCHLPEAGTAEAPCDHYTVVYESVRRENEELQRVGKKMRGIPETFIPARCGNYVKSERKRVRVPAPVCEPAH